MPQVAPRSQPRWPYALAVALLSVLPFLAALGNDFVWDDFLNIHQNTLVTNPGAHGIDEMLTATWAGHYAPLTWLSLAANHAVDGTASARSYILTNLVLHSVNAALVFLLFARLLPESLEHWRLPWAAIGALFFALHPLRVESVVWVTERRDVLSLCFLLLSLLAWMRYEDRKSWQHDPPGLRHKRDDKADQGQCVA
ncbi:MAG: hypothetical protein AAGA45_06605 [Verrucomicrobiota bacterium]